ncbi:DUF3389 family protein [Vibrio viridaestus]|uniref:DUF3389 family protein n=1 Tax=Vibrio viridaestus TaxID=2487322 RepID=A0A3N9TJI5_9VIBR|nr:DUF3389 family protein [Vibrio viridaestus]RQW64479.1 DUF3389 family protein [Vibrio viridaestus]
MVLTLSGGKIIITNHELVIKIDSPIKLTMQAQNEAITLYKDALVIVAHSSDTSWSFKLETINQLHLIAQEISAEVK